ncbi:hypothetical protein C5167_007400 [Papaver somniferum]|nr:hypothetical protein C5167_007400 [Papaver somniferum]
MVIMGLLLNQAASLGGATVLVSELTIRSYMEKDRNSQRMLEN